MGKKYYYLFILLFFGHQLSAQLGKAHWLPPIHSRSADDVEDHYVYISTPSPTPITVFLTYGTTNTSRTISAGNPSRIFIDNGKPSVMFTSDSELNTPINKGVRLVSTEDFYASFRVRSNAQAGYMTTKGESAMGTSFRLGSMPQTTDTEDKNFFLGLMAVENNTTVTISEFNENVIFEGPNAPDGNEVIIVLQEGESYVLSGYTTSTSNYNGFIGTLVTSDLPIVVNTGNALGGFQGNTRDYAIDQIVPVEDVGNEYIVVEGNGNATTERPMVIATVPNTDVFINGNFYVTLTNAGDYILVENSFYQGASHRNMYITSSENVYVYQYLAGDVNEATLGMNFIPPLSCFFQKEVDLIPDIDQIGNTVYEGDLIITTRTGSELTINGDAIGSNPEAVVGTLEWVTYRLGGYRGNTSIASTGPLAVGLFGYNGVAGFGGYYSGFGSIPKDSETAVCSDGLSDLFELLDGNPDPGGIWTDPNGQTHPGFFDPEMDVLGVYNYYLDTGCEIIDVNLNVNDVVVARNAGESNVISLCREEGTVDLFSYLLGNPEPGGEWRTAEGAPVTAMLDLNTLSSGEFTYGFYNNAPCVPIESVVEVKVSSAPEAIEIQRIGTLLSNEPATVEVFATGGLGDYEYQIDDGAWQNSPVFRNLASGNHTVNVRDGNGCGDILSDIVFTLIYPSFFTPNGDNHNDLWKIEGLASISDAPIAIYDRYGRLLIQLDLASSGWDGNFNGRPLPSNDYWFRLIYSEKGNSKIFKSHFTLKR